MGLPGLQAGWVAELLGEAALPSEGRATCEACPMCSEAAPPGRGFAATSKCCTYVPALPNFLAGAILAAEGPGSLQAKVSLRARMRDERCLTPHGVDPSPEEKERYAAVVAAGMFGRDPSLRCPHYLPGSGGCGIWRHRNSVCATWFCRHERGAAGERFWQALERALTAIELELCHHCACVLLGGVEAPAEAAADEVPEWAAFRGREEEYYRRAAGLVATLSAAEVVAIAEEGAGEAIAALRAAHAALRAAPDLDRLVVGTFAEVGREGDEARLLGYSEIDAVAVPAALCDRLAAFDGRPTATVVAALAAAGVEVDEATLRRLIDFGVLVP